jgi:hypothetical protein
MKLVSAGNQQVRHPLYDASGTITSGGTAQLILAQSQSRSFLMFQNLSAHSLYFEFGSARATCSLTSGAVSSVSVTNAGFNFSKPPVVRFMGGGGPGGSLYGSNPVTPYLGLNQPGGLSPSDVATAHCVMTGSAPNMSVSSIVVDHGGSGYLIAPYVFIFNSDLDPYGCAVPSATSGMLLTTGSAAVIFNGTCCTTDPIAVYGATTSDAFICKWMD